MALSDDLICYYSFEGDVTDDTGNYDGTNNGATLNSSGIIGSSYSYAFNDYVATGVKPSVDFTTNEYSIACWIKLSSTTGQRSICTTNNSTAYLRFRQTRPDSGAFDNIGVYIRGDGSSSSNQLVNTTNLTSGTWYHVALVIDSSNVYIYVNGSGQSESKNFTGDFTNIAQDFYIGATNNNGSVTEQFTGDIDELGIWDRALSSSEISELYNSGDGLTYPFSSSSGYTNTVNGVETPAKINGLAVADITAFNGV
jgi:arabinan endo-1,5-alpha-L-arabinosidase